MQIIREVNDLEVIYLSFETIYTLIKKSCITGKFTKAHEVEDNELVKIVFMYSQGFNFLSDAKLGLAESMNLEQLTMQKEIKIQRFKKTKKGSKDIPSLSYFKLSLTQLDAIDLGEGQKRVAQNYARAIEKEQSLGENLIEPLSMKILFAQKLRESNAEQNLTLINQIILKARSVFIHLSAAEEHDSGYTLKFVKEHPFNVCIPDILSFCTTENPSVSFAIANPYRSCTATRWRSFTATCALPLRTRTK